MPPRRAAVSDSARRRCALRSTIASDFVAPTATSSSAVLRRSRRARHSRPRAARPSSRPRRVRHTGRSTSPFAASSCSLVDSGTQGANGRTGGSVTERSLASERGACARRRVVLPRRGGRRRGRARTRQHQAADHPSRRHESCGRCGREHRRLRCRRTHCGDRSHPCGPHRLAPRRVADAAVDGRRSPGRLRLGEGSEERVPRDDRGRALADGARPAPAPTARRSLGG